MPNISEALEDPQFTQQEVKKALECVSQLDAKSIIAATVDALLENTGFAADERTIDLLLYMAVSQVSNAALLSLTIKGKIVCEYSEEEQDLVWKKTES